MYFSSTITRLARMFDVPMDNLEKTENTYVVEQNFLNSLMPPYCLASPPVIEVQRAETSGTSSSTTSTDILEYLQQILQEQAVIKQK